MGDLAQQLAQMQRSGRIGGRATASSQLHPSLAQIL